MLQSNRFFALVPAVVALLCAPDARADIEQAVENVAAPIADFMLKWVFYSVPLFGVRLKIVVMMLIGAAIFCTLYFRFINISAFGRAIGLITGKGEENAPGEVGHFQALATACGATVGLGNIAGVAIAITHGGPGATFWMIIAGLLGMSLKFCECTLAVKYREQNPDGSVSGGPMYYLSMGFAEMGKQRLGRVLAVMFAVFCIGGAIGAGGIFQANQSFTLIRDISANAGIEISGLLFGIVLAVALGVVIIGGIRNIAKVTARVIPFMTLVYVVSAAVVIGFQIDKLPEAVGLIMQGAFSPEGVEGGMLGVMVWGFQRAAFSSEAGVGSAAIAHSAVKTRYPATEGIVSLLEPFIDTVIICTMTSLVIVLTGVHRGPGEMGGIEITSAAFASSIDWFPYVLALTALLFAFSSMISWSYYGLKSWTFLFGESARNKLAFNLIFCALIAVGTPATLKSVINISDSMVFLMVAVNLIGVFAMAGKVREELAVYLRSRG